VLACWIAVFTGRAAAAERWAAVVDAASFDLVPGDGSASFESARAMFRAGMCAAGPEQMLADGSFAAAQEPAWSPWRDTALCMQAEALLLTGDVVQAAAVFAEAATLAATMSNTDSLVDSEAELAVLAMDRGCWAEAAEHLERALGAIDEYRMHDYPTSVLAFAGAARLAVHRGDRSEAERQLTQAMRARPSLTFALPYLAVRVRVQLAKVHWALGDLMTARHLLQEIDDVMHHRPALGTPGGRGRRVSPGDRLEGRNRYDRRIAAQRGGAAAAPLPADPSHHPRHRRTAVCVPQHGQLPGQLHLSKAGRLVA
jgi:LuxR family maltose regulon positive regulatory protein